MKRLILLNQSRRRFTALIPLLLMSTTSVVFAQMSAFTYQGKLTDSGTPANGAYDMQFRLFDNPNAGQGVQQGPTITDPTVQVSVGVFTVQLDFGSAVFAGGALLYLEVSIRPAGSMGGYSGLAPRQQVTSTPYAVQSLNAMNSVNALNATTATNATQLGGQPASQYVITTDARMSDARVPTAGSGSYIQNTNIQQPSTNFNIAGTGTANILDAAFQYNIGGQRVLKSNLGGTSLGIGAGANNVGGQNSFFGTNAGNANTLGYQNSFFGYSAGENSIGGSGGLSSFSNSFFGSNAGMNTAGCCNSFFGALAGQDNAASNNSFFGYKSGSNNSSGTDNAFFGYLAGANNTNGNSNAFFGNQAGRNNSVSGNSFFGSSAGQSSTTGRENSFFGASSGIGNTSGELNSFFGTNAGHTNTTGDNITIIGSDADVDSSNLIFATAIGAGAVVSSSNTIQLGRADGSDFVLIPGLLTIPNLAVAGIDHLCRNAFDRVGPCSSSLRYKTDLAPYNYGLDVINRLHPISFSWKDGGKRDVGFGAEDVEKIEPLFVTYNKLGQVEGVKYDRITVVLVNAIKDQQQQIDELKLIKLQNAELKAQLAAVLVRLEQLERKQGGELK